MLRITALPQVKTYNIRYILRSLSYYGIMFGKEWLGESTAQQAEIWYTGFINPCLSVDKFKDLVGLA